MEQELERLPITTLFEVFTYINAEELLELRFLSKNLFNIIKSIIRQHLCYSTYYNIQSFKQVQNDFIKRFSSHIKHLNLSRSKVFDFREINNNTIYPTYNDELRLIINNEDKQKEFTNLKNINIQIYHRYPNLNLDNILNDFRNLLFNVDKITIYTNHDVDLDSIIQFLNPAKLKHFKISQTKGLKIIMNSKKFCKFILLEKLEFRTSSFEIDPTYQLPNQSDIIFPMLKHLVIHGPDDDIPIFKMFGSLNHLKSIDLKLLKYLKETLELIKCYKVPSVNLNYDFGFYRISCFPPFSFGNYITTLESTQKSLSISNPVLGAIVPLSNIKNITTLSINNLRRESTKNNLNILPFLYIKQIIFYDCDFSVQYLLVLLKYFPNVRKVKFKHSYLSISQHLPLLTNSITLPLLYFDKKDTIVFDEGILSLFRNNYTY